MGIISLFKSCIREICFFNPISYDATLGKIEVRIDCTCAPNIYAVLERCSTPSKGGPESLKYKVVMKDLKV